MRIDVGSLPELQESGYLTTKAGNRPVCVFWHEGRAFGIDDRCPHLGFPLHRGTLEAGLVTCHWHHARFDLCSGATLDPFADDASAYPVEIEGDRVVIVAEERPFDAAAAFGRLDDGLEQGLTLVVAKAVLALLGGGVPAGEVVAAGARFGCRYRGPGWGPGLSVLTATANLLDRLDPAERALALVHGLVFVSRDTAGLPPRFPLSPLPPPAVPGRAPTPAGPGTPAAPAGPGGSPGLGEARLGEWYRRFVETRSADAAERALVTAAASLDTTGLARVAEAAATDHVFLDEGHVLDFTNKAFELVGLLGADSATWVVPTLAHGTTRATRHEEEGPWRHPRDLAAICAATEERLPGLLEGAGWSGGEAPAAAAAAFELAGGPGKLASEIGGDDPEAIAAAIEAAICEGASLEQLSRSVALASALRVARFHTQGDHADWDVVHHGFTTSNALHQLAARSPSPLLVRGVLHSAMKVYLDRFLNLPAARLPTTRNGSLGDLGACMDSEGRVDEAGSIVYGYLRSGGQRAEVVAALGSALLAEDAGFHWFQMVEAAARQAEAWPEGSEEAAWVLVAAARFLAAHTPTRRELPQVVRIAARLGRGDPLYHDDGEPEDAGDPGAPLG
ncbi:MAG: Rieske 2Fe-2S domain-containing protein [Actinomycetota bacterium]|nr:Rieske 2Fe-2S domain-containing protein [Actinomycetota bacterium]